MASSFSTNEGEQVVGYPLTGVGEHLPPSSSEAAEHTFKLKEGCEFYPYDGGHEKEEFIIRTPDKRQYKISALSKKILQLLDGEKTLSEVAEELQERSINITGPELHQFLEKQYGRLSIFENCDTAPDSPADARAKKRSSMPLLIHWTLIPEKFVSRAAARLRFLYHLAAVVPGVILIAFSHYLIYFHQASPHVSTAGALWVLLLALVSVLCHELGHAAAVSKFGGSPGDIGFGLYLLLPTFYADVSEIWRFRRRQRMVVDIGGVYFQQLCLSVFALLNYYTAAPEFLAACYFIDLVAWFNLNPIFRFDGYWLLVDYLALPNLYRQASLYSLYRVKKFLGGSPREVSLPPMRRHIHVIFIIYSLLCNVFFLFAIWASYRYLGSTFSRLWRLYPELLASIYNAVAEHDPVLVLNRLVALFFAIAFPGTALIGMYKYTSLVVSRFVSKIQAHRASSHA